MSQGAQGWCIGTTLRDGMGQDVGGGVRMGETCTPMADSCPCMAKQIQYCKVISLQFKEINLLKINKQINFKKEKKSYSHFQGT